MSLNLFWKAWKPNYSNWRTRISFSAVLGLHMSGISTFNSATSYRQSIAAFLPPCSYPFGMNCGLNSFSSLGLQFKSGFRSFQWSLWSANGLLFLSSFSMPPAAFRNLVWCRRRMNWERLGTENIYAGPETWQLAVQWRRYLVRVVIFWT